MRSPSYPRAPQRITQLLVGLTVLALPTAVQAAPEFVRLSFTSPATDTEMTISWNTSVAASSTVEYGTSPGNLTMTATGSSITANPAFGIVHETAVTNLLPDTTYYYRVGDAVEGWSAEYSFATGPPLDPDCGSFRFAFLGDNRPDATLGGGQNYDAVLQQAMAHNPRFFLNGGDMVEDGNNTGEWLDFFGYNDDTVPYVPYMPCMGNHDDGSGNYNDLYALPLGSGSEEYYYFTYGNAIFVSLSTESFSGGAIPFQDQADWLDTVLTQNPKRWKVVFYHKPTYTHEVFFSISHEPNEENQNAALVPVFDAHHVDVVIASHNHWYERYSPSNCTTAGTPGSNSPCPVAGPEMGTVYLVSGGAGAFTIPAFLCGSATGRVECSGDHHYIVFDVADNVLNMETWGASPEPNVVIDSLTITKPTTGTCATTPGPDAGVPDASVGDAGVGPDSGVPGTDGQIPGADSGPGADGAVGGPDAGGGGHKAGGCSCEAGSTGAPGLPIVLGLLLVALVGLRRRG